MVTELQHGEASPRIGALTAFRRHWLIALMPVVLLVAVAVVLALKRPPQYTATAYASVGPIYFINPAGISGVIQGTQDLAAVYSRTITADAVRLDTARRIGDRRLPTSAHLSATPIPDSPLIKVSATAASAGRAVALVNAACAALTDYVNRQVRESNNAEAISRRFGKAALNYRRRLDVMDRLRRRYASDSSRRNQEALARAAAAADTAQLRKNALFSTYQNTVQATSSKPATQVFSTARSASSDRYTVLQILVFAGLIGGLVAGAALALSRAYRVDRPESP